jgi:hypothetical protein
LGVWCGYERAIAARRELFQIQDVVRISIELDLPHFQMISTPMTFRLAALAAKLARNRN